MRIPIHREGWPFIAIFAVVNAALLLLSTLAGIVFAPLSLWCIAFFRDPERGGQRGARLILAPADGTVVSIVETDEPTFLEARAVRISIRASFQARGWPSRVTVCERSGS